MAWIRRVLTAFFWCVLVFLVLQGLAKFRFDPSTPPVPIFLIMAIYSVLCHCIRRKIEIAENGDYMELHKLPAVHNTVLSLSDDFPIMIIDSPARRGLRNIQLNAMRSDFKMLITDDESKRLASWADGNSDTVAYRRRD